MNHVLWTVGDVENACRLSEMRGFEDKWMIRAGRPVSAEISGDVSFEMDPDFPDDTLTPDHLKNISTFIVVSERAAEVLKTKADGTVEYIPVSIIDHKRRRIKDKYFVINPTAVLPVLKLSECDAVVDDLNEDALERMNKFVVDEVVLATSPAIFRAKFISDYVWVSAELARALNAAGLDGNRWIRPPAIATGEMLGDLSVLPTEASVVP